ncbi:hypothetical protein CACET_c30410 [Clostridium aceticum]|uniref:Uncharacterized protein n=1 Tax=Clostridium aceticum TaxID=84022 RepID=A0A0D8IAR7_9CLOT|nr:hypothetical protein [Clostridium aceticum]AKL96485.1 hypothetical protein CACET_c30410 [Clostridium aceticum]KJF27343.1 hypothetical protein TZ02_08380 [Clostridium aceticum]
MITAYLVGISGHYEGEDIEIRYCIYDNEELVSKKSILEEYKKPGIVSLFALTMLLKELEKYIDREIIVKVNDAALVEQMQGTSTTKNKEVLKAARIAREKVNTFEHPVIVKDISNDIVELAKWNDLLQR